MGGVDTAQRECQSPWFQLVPSHLFPHVNNGGDANQNSPELLPKLLPRSRSRSYPRAGSMSGHRSRDRADGFVPAHLAQAGRGPAWRPRPATAAETVPVPVPRSCPAWSPSRTWR